MRNIKINISVGFSETEECVTANRTGRNFCRLSAHLSSVNLRLLKNLIFD